MLPPIILASRSPTRKDLLDRLGVKYQIYPSTFDEQLTKKTGERFSDLACRLALGKTYDVAAQVQTPVLVIGADTFGVCDGESIGKPHTPEKAVAVLRQFSGRRADFYTGMTVVDTAHKKTVSECVRATVYFRKLSVSEIRQYVAKGDALEAAGGFKIHELGAVLVRRVIGDYYAIVGLSPSKLAEMFNKLGHNVFEYVSKNQ